MVRHDILLHLLVSTHDRRDHRGEVGVLGSSRVDRERMRLRWVDLPNWDRNFQMREELTGNQRPPTPHLDIEEERPVAVFQGRAPHGGRGVKRCEFKHDVFKGRAPHGGRGI